LRKRKSGRKKTPKKESNTEIGDVFNDLAAMKKQVEDAFRLMDTDKNRTIDTSEFKYFLEFIAEKNNTPMPSIEVI